MSIFPTVSRRRRPRKAKDESGPGLTREAIIAATIELIDREGLESFSMRNVAKKLEVYPTAIYWHVPGRNALVAEVIALVLKDLVPAGDLPWQSWLRALFVRYRERIREHPNVAPLIGVQLVSNASLDFDMIEAILAKLVEAGFSGERLVSAYNAVIAGMVGYTTQEFAMVPPEEQEEWRDGMRAAIAKVDPVRYPVLGRTVSGLANRSFILRWENGVDAPLDSGFELFVDALILGLERLAATMPGAAS